MLYCYNCGNFTTGNAFYCNFCGRSYDVKLCSRLHVNPRSAEVCSQCGTRDLSTPQPKVPLRIRVLAFLGFVLLGMFETFIVVFLVGCLVVAFLTRQDVQRALLSLGFLAAALWIIWTMLPLWFRKFVYRLLQRTRKSREDNE